MTPIKSWLSSNFGKIRSLIRELDAPERPKMSEKMVSSRLGKRELICLLLFTCNYVVFVWRGFLFLWVLGMGYVILLWHSLSLPYNYCSSLFDRIVIQIAGNPKTNKKLE